MQIKTFHHELKSVFLMFLLDIFGKYLDTFDKYPYFGKKENVILVSFMNTESFLKHLRHILIIENVFNINVPR